MAELMRKTSLVGGMTLLSRILGYLRDWVMAHAFGAGGAMDAFVVAFKIPNFFRRLFAEGAFSQAFIPLLAQYKNEDPRTFSGAAMGNLAMVLFIVTALGIGFAPEVITLFAPGFSDEPERFTLAIELLHLTFGYVFLISLTALLGGILNSYKYFALPALAPIWLNISLIFATFFKNAFSPQILCLGYGVLLGGVTQLLLLMWGTYKAGVFPRLHIDWKNPKIRRLLTLMGPAVVGGSVAQINLLIDTWFASFLPVGSVSYLYYADRLLELPLGIFGVALATVMLPNLSDMASKKDIERFTHMLSWALRLVILIGLPAAVGLYLAAPLVMNTLFAYGAFTSEAATASSTALMAYAVGLPSMIAIKVLVSGHYARQNTKTPVKIACVCLVVNTALNFVLMQAYSYVGLALATSISATLNALLLAVTLKLPIFTVQLPYLAKSGLACALMGVILVVPPELLLGDLHKVAQLGILVTASMIAYFGVLYGLKVRPHHLRFKV